MSIRAGSSLEQTTTKRHQPELPGRINFKTVAPLKIATTVECSVRGLRAIYVGQKNDLITGNSRSHVHLAFDTDQAAQAALAKVTAYLSLPKTSKSYFTEEDETAKGNFYATQCNDCNMMKLDNEPFSWGVVETRGYPRYSMEGLTHRLVSILHDASLVYPVVVPYRSQ